MIHRMPEYGDYAHGMPGGIDNPLGARALYLYRGNQDTYFRLHGTNEPTTIGEAVSSGCIRLFNQDIIDLYNRVPVGAPVVVLQEALAPSLRTEVGADDFSGRAAPESQAATFRESGEAKGSCFSALAFQSGNEGASVPCRRDPTRDERGGPFLETNWAQGLPSILHTSSVCAHVFGLSRRDCVRGFSANDEIK